MKKLKLTKVISSTLIVASVLGLSPIGASAAWKQDKFGLWYYTEGSSNASGWKLIDGKWYYFSETGDHAMMTTKMYIDNHWYNFDSSGAMLTGWVKETDNWYYYYSNGQAAENTTIDGYVIGKGGGWDKNPEFTYEKALEIGQNKYADKTDVSVSIWSFGYKNDKKYFHMHLASKSAQAAGGSGTLGNYRVYADGTIEEM